MSNCLSLRSKVIILKFHV